MKKISILVCFLMTLATSYAQEVNVIDHKGTKNVVNNNSVTTALTAPNSDSKWNLRFLQIHRNRPKSISSPGRPWTLSEALDAITWNNTCAKLKTKVPEWIRLYIHFDKNTLKNKQIQHPSKLWDEHLFLEELQRPKWPQWQDLSI